MGLWWENIDATPPDEGFVTFDSDPDALSKRWPILWRFCQNWQILCVEGWDAANIHFQSENGQCMRLRYLVLRRYVAVRIGPEKVSFWATNKDGKPRALTRTGHWIPGLFRKDDRTPAEAIATHRLRRSIEFV